MSESTAPPAGMMAVELEAEWLAQSEHLDYRNWLQAHVIHLRGEVAQLREQEIELRKSLESARRDIARRNNLITEIRARAALESTTPQEEK